MRIEGFQRTMRGWNETVLSSFWFTLNDINLTGENINAINNTDAFLVASKKTGLDVNSEKK